jgi:hypothetical protein
VLDRAARVLGTPSPKAVDVVFNHWVDVVGETLAARTRPGRIDGQTLVVVCDEPIVATHVRYLESQILQRVTELCGERRLTRVDLRVSK